jgi:hypothetical protein
MDISKNQYRSTGGELARVAFIWLSFATLERRRQIESGKGQSLK